MAESDLVDFAGRKSRRSRCALPGPDGKAEVRGRGPLHERALAIRETALGPEHPDTATSLDNLASRWIAGPWIRSALPMSGANRPGPGKDEPNR
jgi:hypothetical protein